MKLQMLLTVLIILMTKSVLQAQAPLQTVIESVRVQYRPEPLSVNALPGRFNVIPEALISLRDMSTAAKIYFKVYNLRDSLLYQAHYSLNSDSLVNAQGKKIFNRSGNKVSISTGTVCALKRYKYKIYTEDTLHVFSSELLTIQ